MAIPPGALFVEAKKAVPARTTPGEVRWSPSREPKVQVQQPEARSSRSRDSALAFEKASSQIGLAMVRADHSTHGREFTCPAFGLSKYLTPKLHLLSRAKRSDYLGQFPDAGLTYPQAHRPVVGENRWLRFLYRGHREYLRRAA